MYCVKCGVRLQDGTEKCPLCGTPVWNPDAEEKENRYSGNLPAHHNDSAIPAAAALTVITAIAAAVITIVCLKLYGHMAWGGYVVSSLALFYVIAVLPLWFHNPPAIVFLPVDFAAVALFLLVICLLSGGKWFLSFALPVTLLAGALTVALFCLIKYVKGGTLFILGGFLIMTGLYTVLIEFFEHLTFGTPMFLWSLYSLAACALAGIFLILSGVIRPLREMFRRRFFF